MSPEDASDRGGTDVDWNKARTLSRKGRVIHRQPDGQWLCFFALSTSGTDRPGPPQPAGSGPGRARAATKRVDQRSALARLRWSPSTVTNPYYRRQWQGVQHYQGLH